MLLPDGARSVTGGIVHFWTGIILSAEVRRQQQEDEHSAENTGNTNHGDLCILSPAANLLSFDPHCVRQQKRPGFCRAAVVRTGLLSCHRNRIPLGDYFLRVIRKGARLRQQFERLDHLGVGFRSYLQPFFLSEGIDEQLRLDVRA